MEAEPSISPTGSSCSPPVVPAPDAGRLSSLLVLAPALVPVLLSVIVAGCDSSDPGAPALPVEPAPSPPSSRAVTFAACMNGLPDTGRWKCDPVLADVNGDGALDLAAIPRHGAGPRVWLAGGDGSWTDASAGLEIDGRSCGGGLDFGDVNDDGYLDLLVADHCAGVFVYLGNGGTAWEPAPWDFFTEEMADDDRRRPQHVGADDIAGGDVNGDGHVDLIVGTADVEGIGVFLGDGTGRSWTWAKSEVLAWGWAARVMLRDLDGDGRLDVVASHSRGPRVWLNDGGGVWRASSVGLPSPILPGVYVGLDVGDVNEDGRLDLVVAGGVDGPEVFLQGLNGTWHETPDVFPAMRGGAIGLALGDLNGDGHLDMAVSGRLEVKGGFVRGVFALLGDGDGHWTPVRDSGLPSTGLGMTAGVAIGDVDGDGTPDVAVSSGLSVERGEGTLTEPVIPTHLLVWCTKRRPAPAE